MTRMNVVCNCNPIHSPISSRGNAGGRSLAAALKWIVP